MPDRYAPRPPRARPAGLPAARLEALDAAERPPARARHRHVQLGLDHQLHPGFPPGTAR